MTEAEKKDLELSKMLIKMKDESYNRMMIEREKQERRSLLWGMGSLLALAAVSGGVVLNILEKNNQPKEPVKIERQVTQTPYQKHVRSR